MTTAQSTRTIHEGKVIAIPSETTVVVSVVSTRLHAKYRKRFQISKKYQVHNPGQKYQIGDTVSFIDCAPISARKRWVVKTDTQA